MDTSTLRTPKLTTLIAATLLCSHGCAGHRHEQETRPAVEYYDPPPQTPGATADLQTGTTPTTAGCNNAPHQLFPSDTWFNRSVTTAPRARDSDAIIQFLESSPQKEGKFQVDFSFALLEAESSTKRHKFRPSVDHYSPDCDLAPVPLPTDGRIEGEVNYACDGNGDCHLLVLDRQECRLYEMFRADFRPDWFDGGCLAVWNIAQRYPENGRGEHCSSADAAGLPIAPLLFTAHDIARGEISHALRFVLPNAMIRKLSYVRPGTHSTHSTNGPATAPPYGALLRLKRDFDVKPFKPAARVVLTALQNYGMYLADGGRITFTAASDATGGPKWSNVGFGPHDLKALRWSDFEVVDSGETRTWQGSCQRDPITK